MRISVGIATVSRPDLVQVVLGHIARQSRPPDRIVVCAPSGDDVGAAARAEGIELVLGPRGLTRQRNAILDRAAAADAVVFFDDDFLPAPSYLEVIERVFAAHPDIAMVTGTVVADGIIGPGITVEEAHRQLAAIVPPAAGDGMTPALKPAANGYGCNMAVRMLAVAGGQCRFDERLPLYGWLEDVDFSRQLARHGRIVKVPAACGVHLGIKRGRQSGVRLGYSQIANPVYLARKGTCPWSVALRLMSRNVAANCLHSLRPEPYIDRLGRALGNTKALRDLVAGRLAPERILEL